MPIAGITPLLLTVCSKTSYSCQEIWFRRPESLTETISYHHLHK